MKIPIIVIGAILAALSITNRMELSYTPEAPLPLSMPTPVERFMQKVAVIESGGNHRVVNEFGMMGKYQFHPATVRQLGFRVSNKDFLNNETLQDTVMYAYMKANYQDLKFYINKYNGKYFKGTKITTAGILAGAHFAGSGGVIKYFSNADIDGISDARGTTLKYYMGKFSSIHLPSRL